MVAFGPSVLCADAEPYYYDYLCGLGTGIPDAVGEHIRHCVRCRTQIRQLEAAVAESETRDRRPQADTQIIGALSLHFAHIGEDITCAKAKSFLPALLIPSLGIRIPTPITVHIDHCHRCAEDLEAIRALELRPEQLARLSRLYAAAPGGGPQMCRRTRAKTWAFACASFEGIDAEVLDHVCACPRCRRRVYRCREKILAGRQPGDTIPGVGLCSGISTAELFEWVVPFGRTSDDPGPLAGDEAVPSHLQACPECIERMQALHRTIYGVAERVDSGVSTVYTPGGAREMDGRADGSRADYPIHVEVAYREPDPVATRLRPIARAGELLRRGVANPQFRPLLRTVLAAAAVIPLAMALLINIRPASGISARELTRAVKRVENVHIKVLGRDSTTITQEIWAARARTGGWIIVDDAQRKRKSIYDVTQRHQQVIYHDGKSETVHLTPDEIEAAEQGINEILVSTSVETPAGLDSQPLTRVPVAQAQDGNDIYELTWQEKSSGDPAPQFMLRVFVDPVTGLPRKIENLSKVPDEELWRKSATRVFKYPSREEMESVKADMFGDR